jgi:hypothetical protein
VTATRTGGVLGLGLSAILAVLGSFAPRRSYQETETWLILAKADRPPPAIAQQVVGETLRETYHRFAECAVAGSILLLGLSLILKLAAWVT